MRVAMTPNKEYGSLVVTVFAHRTSQRIIAAVLFFSRFLFSFAASSAFGIYKFADPFVAARSLAAFPGKTLPCRLLMLVFSSRM